MAYIRHFQFSRSGDVFLKSIRSSIPAFLRYWFLRPGTAQDFALLDDTRNWVLPPVPKVVNDAASDLGFRLTAHYRCAKKRHRLCFRKFASRPAGYSSGQPEDRGIQTQERRIHGKLVNWRNSLFPRRGGYATGSGEVWDCHRRRQQTFLFDTKALPVGEVCVVCHGTQENLSVDLSKQALDKNVPRRSPSAINRVRFAEHLRLRPALNTLRSSPAYG